MPSRHAEVLSESFAFHHAQELRVDGHQRFFVALDHHGDVSTRELLPIERYDRSKLACTFFSELSTFGVDRRHANLQAELHGLIHVHPVLLVEHLRVIHDRPADLLGLCLGGGKNFVEIDGDD